MTAAPQAATEPTYGVLLAGGLARRMGGGDKTLRTVGGRPILHRIVERLAPQCEGLLLNANGEPGRFAFLGHPVVADEVEGFAGPLAGLLAGLDWLAERQPNVGWVVSVPGDTPFVPRDLVARLHAARRAGAAPIACATSGGRIHPVVALWSAALRHELRAFLVEEGLRKVGQFIARHRVVEAEWPIEPFDPFFNANAPEDIVTAEEIARDLDARLAP